MDGFRVRVVAQTEKAAREVTALATEVTDEGLDAYGVMLAQIAASLRTFSRAALYDLPMDDIADRAHELHGGLRHAGVQMRCAAGGLSGPGPVTLARIACDLEKVAVVMRKINYDALGETQPLGPVIAKIRPTPSR